LQRAGLPPTSPSALVLATEPELDLGDRAEDGDPYKIFVQVNEGHDLYAGLVFKKGSYIIDVGANGSISELTDEQVMA
jgi:hypothetical protein